MGTTRAEQTPHNSDSCSDQELTFKGKNKQQNHRSGLLYSALVRGAMMNQPRGPKLNNSVIHIRKKEYCCLLSGIPFRSNGIWWAKQRSFNASVLNLMTKKHKWTSNPKSLDVSGEKMLEIVEFAEEQAPLFLWKISARQGEQWGGGWGSRGEVDHYLLARDPSLDGPVTADGFPSRACMLRFFIRCRHDWHTHSHFTSCFQWQWGRLPTRLHSETGQAIVYMEASDLIPNLLDEPSNHSVGVFLISQPMVKVLIGWALRTGEMAENEHGSLWRYSGKPRGGGWCKKTIPWHMRDSTAKPRMSANSAYLSVLFAWMSYFASWHAAW